MVAANGDVWNARSAPPTYEITGTSGGATISWQLFAGARPVPGATGSGPSPLTVTLDDAPDGRQLHLVAGQISPPDGRAQRTFLLDTRPPTITVTRPVAGAVYERGARVLAAYTCAAGAVTCEGTVADGAPLDTGTAGAKVVTDAAGNAAEERVEYRVAPPPTPAPPPSGTPAGTPTPPSPTIRPAPAPRPTGGGTALPTRDADELRPTPGAVLTDSRPVLRWTAVGGARLYNVQVYRVRGEQVAKVLSEFPTGTRLRPPAVSCDGVSATCGASGRWWAGATPTRPMARAGSSCAAPPPSPTGSTRAS